MLPADTGAQRAAELLEPVALAYRHFDNPAGARFKVGKVKPAVPDPSNLHPAGPGLFGRRSVLGVREAAALWHPPGAGDETPLVERSGARGLSPSARGVRGGALVGDTTAGKPMPIRFPEDLLRRHHLYVARTRMGKSTLMHHLVAHKMKEKAEGRDGDAIIVIDPHTDLVAGLLEHVPESLIDRVRLIDLSDHTRAPGINLLDTRIFADRDRTADSVVRVARGLWEQWGPRMQSILEQTVKTLHEANEHPDHRRRRAAHHPGRAAAAVQRPVPQRRPRQGLRPLPVGVVDQGLRQLAPPVPGRGPGPRADPPLLLRVVEAGAGHPGPAPLHHRPARDHPRRRNPAGLHVPGNGRQGRGRPGGRVPPQPGRFGHQGTGRHGPPGASRRTLVVVDEMQSMPGVDYESMLSELGKFGASFILATQSLAKLDDLSRTMRDTLLANVGCLAVFQVAGSDARHLVWELGKDRVTEEDIVSLPVHHCYVRSTVGIERMPAFSMMVRKPEEGDASVAARIRGATAGYTLTARQAAHAAAEDLKKVEEFRQGVEELKRGADPAPKNESRPGGKPERRSQPGKRRRTREAGE